MQWSHYLSVYCSLMLRLNISENIYGVGNGKVLTKWSDRFNTTQIYYKTLKILIISFTSSVFVLWTVTNGWMSYWLTFPIAKIIVIIQLQMY